MRHKIIIGEWVSVYVNQTLIVDTDKDIKNMSAVEVGKLLDTDDNTQIVDTCQRDYYWDTEEHEQWDDHDDCGYTYVEPIGENDETELH